MTTSIYNLNKDRYYCKVNGDYIPWKEYFINEGGTENDFNKWQLVKETIKALIDNDAEKDKDSLFFIFEP
jgi:hypothetical protein